MYGLESLLAILIGLMIVGGFWYMNRVRRDDLRSNRPIPIRVRVDDKRGRHTPEPEDDWTAVDEEKHFWWLLLIVTVAMVVVRFI